MIDIKTKPALDIRASMHSLLYLCIYRLDFADIAAILQTKIQQSADLFNNAPMVLDLTAVSVADSSEIEALIKQVEAHGMRVIGIASADQTVQAHAKHLKLSIFKARLQENKLERPNQPKPSQPLSKTQLITQPVRSGQQLYAKQCDMIVMTAVSHGAEVIADGHIHIYGSLRGKAAAGVNGNKEARIFCQVFEAELVSIAGQYLISEQLDAYHGKTAVQIYLEGDKLTIAPYA